VSSETRNLLMSAAERAATYLEHLDDRAVAPTALALELLERVNEPLPLEPGDGAQSLALLDEYVSPATMAMAGPRFFGMVIGGALPVAVAANWMATAWDQNAAFYRSTPGAARLEQVAARWVTELLDLPRGTAAGFVTGATMANFTSLAAARHAILEQVGWSVEADGLQGAPPITVIAGEEGHVSLFKALALLGLGHSRVVRVPVDRQGQMRADAFPEISGPTIVCLQAGNVNTGGCDPFTAIIPRARAAGAWVHVDGAFALWAKAAPTRSHLLNGVEEADSWAIDAHKWLNVPYDSGIALVREERHLRAALTVSADYLPSHTPERNPSDYTPELSRRARGVEVWAVLRTLGRKGVSEIIERNCRQARRFAERLRAAGHDILNDVVLNQVMVAFGDPETTRRVVSALQEDGTCWCGGTLWQGRTAMRISVSSWATRDEDVERSVDAMLRVVAATRCGSASGSVGGATRS
jgi:glutamate/tyrosine decarboxylase-like PLP-dependent enzyme